MPTFRQFAEIVDLAEDLFAPRAGRMRRRGKVKKNTRFSVRRENQEKMTIGGVAERPIAPVLKSF
jgi:hypothetical protein